MSKLEPGTRIAERFTLIERIGVGGFGTVWSASDAVSSSRVAIKLLHLHLLTNDSIRERFAREATALSRLAHANIATFVAADVAHRTPFIVVEFVAGETLTQILLKTSNERSLLSAADVRAYFEPLARAIAHAHQHGVIHRDLKPGNIIVSESTPRLKVIDFGIAKLIEREGSAWTTKGRVIGTLGYLSPEQVVGAPVDARTDVFALGVLLFELLTLRRPWSVGDAGPPRPFREVSARRGATERAAVLGRIVRGERPVPSALRPSIGKALDLVVARSLALSAEDRFRSVDEQLEAVLSALSSASFERAEEEDASPEVMASKVSRYTAILPQTATWSSELVPSMSGVVRPNAGARVARKRKKFNWAPPVLVGVALSLSLAAVALIQTPQTPPMITKPSIPERTAPLEEPVIRAALRAPITSEPSPDRPQKKSGVAAKILQARKVVESDPALAARLAKAARVQLEELAAMQGMRATTLCLKRLDLELPPTALDLVGIVSLCHHQFESFGGSE